MSFFMVLPSNTKFRDNKPNKFRVILPKALNFNSDWFCSLYSISYTHSWPSIGTTNNETIIIDTDDGKKYYYNIPSFSPASPQALADVINKKFTPARLKRKAEDAEMEVKEAKLPPKATLPVPKLPPKAPVPKLPPSDGQTSDVVTETQTKAPKLPPKATLPIPKLPPAAGTTKTDVIVKHPSLLTKEEAAASMDSLKVPEPKATQTPTETIDDSVKHSNTSKEPIIESDGLLPKRNEEVSKEEDVTVTVTAPPPEEQKNEAVEKKTPETVATPVETADVVKHPSTLTKEEVAAVAAAAKLPPKATLPIPKLPPAAGTTKIDVITKHPSLLTKEEIAAAAKAMEALPEQPQDDGITYEVGKDPNLNDPKIPSKATLPIPKLPPAAGTTKTDEVVKHPALLDPKLPPKAYIPVPKLPPTADPNEFQGGAPPAYYQGRRVFHQSLRYDIIEKPLPFHMNVEWNENLHRYQINSEKNIFISMTPQLAYALGYKNEEDIIINEPAPYTPDLQGINQFGVYADGLIEGTVIGDTIAPLLRIVNTAKSQPGQTVEIIYDTPIFNRITSKNIHEIDIEIRSMDGQLVPFDYGYVIVTLQFQKTKSI